MVIIAVTMVMMRPGFRSCCTSAKDRRCSYMFWNMGAPFWEKKSPRSVLKTAGKAAPIKVRLKLPKKLNLKLDFRVSTAPNGRNAGKHRRKAQISSARLAHVTI
jgi:hypothetical protein